MKLKLELTKAALSDLRAVRRYTSERWGSDQEKIYLEELWEKFEEISVKPALWKFREDLFPSCQIASQGKHIILFRVHDQTLQIARILHSAMDYKRHVPKDLKKI